jgi:hypothetical membrane protein
MKRREDLVRFIRRSQTFISIMLFFGVFLFCWDITGFELTEIQLSKWGETGSIVERIWNGVICLLSISIFLNTHFYIKHNKRIKYKNVSHIMFSFVSFVLFMVGFFNVDYYFLHNFGAYLYFFTFPFFIFLFAHIHRKSLKYQDWIHHMILSICMMVFPLIFLSFFNGMAISEIAHTIFVVLWNFKIAFKRILPHNRSI